MYQIVQYMITNCGDTQAKSLANHFFILRTGAKLIVLKKIMGYFRDLIFCHDVTHLRSDMNTKFCGNILLISLTGDIFILRSATKFDVLKIENGANYGPSFFGMTF